MKGFTLWFTGLSGAGKSTIANKVYHELKRQGYPAETLEGDDLRRRISSDLGYSREDRRKHLERVTYIAEVLSRNGIIALVSLISPYESDREFARNTIGEFREIYVKCPLQICKERDVKGLYKKALAGEIKQFTGIDDPYEEPSRPDLILDTHRLSVDECVAAVLAYLEDNKMIQKGGKSKSNETEF